MFVARKIEAFEQSGNVDPLNLNNHLFGGFFEAATTERAEENLRKLAARYGMPSCGRNRATFMLKNHVLKFPLNNNGEADNDWEGSCKGDTLAVGRCVTIDGFICVVQEKVRPVTDNDELTALPEWVGFIDGYQVGYNSKGILKAYDFGYR